MNQDIRNCRRRTRWRGFVVLAAFVFILTQTSQGAFARQLPKESKIVGWEGKQFEILMSSEDALCHYVFDMLEREYDPNNQEHAIEEYDPIFVKWGKFSLANESSSNIEAEASLVDINNDGLEETLIRVRYFAHSRFYLDRLHVFPEIEKKLLQVVYSVEDLNRLHEYKIDFAKFPSRGVSGYELKNAYVGRISKPYLNETPEYWHRGYISPLIFAGKTYVLARQSNDTQAGDIALYALVFLFDEYKTTKDICYINKT